jgi:hypothetical protein
VALLRSEKIWQVRGSGSAIETSKIAGHSTVSMTGDSTVVQLQEQLTRAIQGRRAKATAENPDKERHKLAIVEAA